MLDEAWKQYPYSLIPSQDLFRVPACRNILFLGGLVSQINQSRAPLLAQWQVEWLGLDCRVRSLIKVHRSRCSLDGTRPVVSINGTVRMPSQVHGLAALSKRPTDSRHQDLYCLRGCLF